VIADLPFAPFRAETSTVPRNQNPSPATMHLVVNYAVLGFRPSFELGEFVNVGVLAVEPRSRYLAFRLASPQRTKRISACFPELDLAIYRNGVRRIESELAALAIETNVWSDDSHRTRKHDPAQNDLFVAEGDMEFFQRLTAPTTSTFFYSAKGTRLAADLEQCLEELYGRYVEHWNYAPADYEEKKLAREIKRLLHSRRLGKLYREAPWVGTDAYHVGIPLAYLPKNAEVPRKAIKPLNLTQPTPTKIYTHGDEWIAKVRRLERVGCLPESFLFVVKKPRDDERLAAAEEICEGLRQAGVSVLEIGEDEAILDFAEVHDPEDFSLE